MAVFTQVSNADLVRFLGDYDLGVLQAFEGVESGAENTNYKLTTTAGEFILTLFERRVREADLPYFSALMAHLAAKGLPAPKPVRRKDGGDLGRLCGRPALIVTFLPGGPRLSPTPGDCRALGEMLALLHEAGRDFPPGQNPIEWNPVDRRFCLETYDLSKLRAPVRAELALARGNDLSLEGWRALAAKCGPLANVCAPDLASLIDDELLFLSANWPSIKPQGAIHGDLFPDNVFFDDQRICGLIDFYFACTDMFVLDIAVCLNSWAVQGGAWSMSNADALLGGYQSRRPLTEIERSALPTVLRGAALRFLLTRLYDWLHRVDGARVTVKSPLEFRDILLIHRDAAPDSLYTL